jgi:hypothetical protein
LIVAISSAFTPRQIVPFGIDVTGHPFLELPRFRLNDECFAV